VITIGRQKGVDGVINQERDGSAFNKNQQRPAPFETEGRLSGREGNRRHTHTRSVQPRLETVK
jgi:hypothetical protein